jgi:hypothetical protein
MSDPAALPLHPPLSDRSRHQQERFAHGIEWKVVGPMPVDEFLDEFFPCSDPMDLDQGLRGEGIAHGKINFDSVPDSPNMENEMYAGLVSMEQPILSLFNLTNLSVPV